MKTLMLAVLAIFACFPVAYSMDSAIADAPPITLVDQGCDKLGVSFPAPSKFSLGVKLIGTTACASAALYSLSRAV